jgi:predicted kinase
MAIKSAPVLIALGGLPGSGKSSLALGLAASVGALYLRIDTIEQAIRNASGAGQPVGEEGYCVAYAVAEDNLRLGQIVIADSVNAFRETRNAWREVAGRTGSIFLEVEVVCSDAAVHRERVETRRVGIAGLKLPTWEEVLAREYEPWDRDHVVVDTAHRSLVDCVEEVRGVVMPCMGDHCAERIR